MPERQEKKFKFKTQYWKNFQLFGLNVETINIGSHIHQNKYAKKFHEIRNNANYTTFRSWREGWNFLIIPDRILNVRLKN